MDQLIKKLKAMKSTKIQDSKTRQIIRYFINNVRVTERQHEDEINRHLTQKKGCYNSSITSRTKNGNYKHVAFYSI